MTGRPGLRRPHGPAAAGALAAMSAGLMLAGCGIPTQATARAIPASEVPRNVNASPVTTTTDAATRAGAVPTPVYFISTGAYIVPKSRYVKPSATVTAAIDTLLAGPTTRELYSTGTTTAFPRGTGIRLLHTSVAGNVVTLNFNTTFGFLSNTEEVLGVAQVVYTATEALKATDGVIIEINGGPIPVPMASGQLTSAPVHQSSYAALLKPATPATSTTTSAAP